MEITTKQIFNILYILAWIIFVGICIDAAGLIVHTFSTVFLSLGTAQRLWKEIDLSNLYAFDHGYFLIIAFTIIVVALIKAIMFYCIIKIIHDKKLDLSQPFTKDVQKFIFLMSYMSLGIGLFCSCGTKYAHWLTKRGVAMPDIRLDGADVWFFMSVILYIIAQIFKRGIELQTENDLTV